MILTRPRAHAPFIILALCSLVAGCRSSTSPVSAQQSSAVLVALEDSKRVMWLGAHPDDENAVSGLLARVKDVARKLYFVTLTPGENENTRASDPISGRFTNPWGEPSAKRGSELGERRAAVFRTLAKRVYRVDGIDIGPFVNGPLSLAELDALPPDAPFKGWVNEPPDLVIRKWANDVGGTPDAPKAYVVSLIRRWRPDAVIGWDEWCSGSGNPEHRAAAKLLHEAVKAAADPLYPDPAHPAADAWKVKYVLAAAVVIPPLVECGYCKCQGEPPSEQLENIALDVHSDFYGAEYFDIKCRAISGYANAEQDGDLTPTELATIRANCPAEPFLEPSEPVRLLLSF